ncbi:MAG: LacI family DNA-binding transcriptional regulator [Eubacteriales bacterium]
MEKYFKIATLKDIASEAGISVTAVSKVLNHKGGISRETVERVMVIAEHLGYRANFIAKSLKINSTKTLGLVISDSSQSFFGTIIKGAEEEAARNGYNIILANTNRKRETEKKAINILLQKRIDGLLLAASMLTRDEDIGYLDSMGIPYVFLIRRSERIEVSFVGNDNVLGASCMVDYLIKTGSRKIHFLNMAKNSTSSQERLSGYINSLESNGIAYDPSLVYYISPKIEEGYRVMRNILENGGHAEALFCGCDNLSIGAIEAILEKGLDVPRDVRVCGYDDIEFAAYLRRPLTTMRQPKEIIGTKGVELLLNQINRVNDQPKIILLKSELVVRQST